MIKTHLRKTMQILIMFALPIFIAAQSAPQTPIPGIKKTTPAKEPDPPVTFLKVLQERLALGELTLEKFCPPNNIVYQRILTEYGAVFVGQETFPAPCILSGEEPLQNFQAEVGYSTKTVGGVRIELQTAAMDALLKAVAEAKKQGLTITPRGGALAARRSYAQTVSLWKSRVLPGLNYWTGKKRITPARAQAIREMPVFDQIEAILELESEGIYFAKNFDKSILTSVAAPGASQHNWMLALDVVQFADPKVRAILARHGWFQTVATDLPHFTYLGVDESELESLGLHQVKAGGQVFWVPKLTAAP